MRRRIVGISLGVVSATIIAFVVASCGDSTAPANKTYVAANMSSAAEGGTFTSPGSGTFTFVDLGTEFQWTLELSNMTGVTASHIHLGDATAVGSTAGPVIINLFIPNGATA